MKTSKRILTLGIAAALMSGAAAIHAQDVSKTTDIPVLISAHKPVFAVHIDGKLIDSNTYVDGDTVMIPLRSICEALGYEVTWHDEAQRIEVIKMPHFITLSIGNDGYTFSKTAPMPLGKAPELNNDKTYVPVNFISEMLQYEYTVEENGEINIITEETASVGKGVLKVENGVISIEDETRGEVILNISDETVIVNESGETLDKSALTDGARALVEYSPVMTASLPPHNTPVKIVVSAADSLTGKGILKTEDNRLLIEDEIRGDVVLNVSDETVIENENGDTLDKSSLTDGTTVLVEYSEIMTMSLPPINNPVKITVLNADKEEASENTGSGTIKIEDEAIIVEDEVIGDVILNISDETVIEDKDGNALDAKALADGVKVTVTYGDIMTRSLPPINTPVKIIVFAD